MNPKYQTPPQNIEQQKGKSLGTVVTSKKIKKSKPLPSKNGSRIFFMPFRTQRLHIFHIEPAPTVEFQFAGPCSLSAFNSSSTAMAAELPRFTLMMPSIMTRAPSERLALEFVAVLRGDGGGGGADEIEELERELELELDEVEELVDVVVFVLVLVRSVVAIARVLVEVEVAAGVHAG